MVLNPWNCNALRLKPFKNELYNSTQLIFNLNTDVNSHIHVLFLLIDSVDNKSINHVAFKNQIGRYKLISHHIEVVN